MANNVSSERIERMIDSTCVRDRFAGAFAEVPQGSVCCIDRLNPPPEAEADRNASVWQKLSYQGVGFLQLVQQWKRARSDAQLPPRTWLTPSGCRFPIVDDAEEIVGEVGVTQRRTRAAQRVGADVAVSVRVHRFDLIDEIGNGFGERVEADSEPGLDGRQLRGVANDAGVLHPAARQMPPGARRVDRRELETARAATLIVDSKSTSTG